MASLKELIVKIGADTTGLSKGVDTATQKLEGLKVTGEGLVAIGAGLSASVTAPIVAMGAAALTAGGQMELARMSFDTMLGSAEASAAFLKDLQDFAKSTPFSFDGLVAASKQMLAFGFAASDILPNLTAVGDAIAAVGGGEEAIQGVNRALGQMAAKGKVSAEEINQLAERGIGAWKYLASEAGVSIAEIQKLAEKGALDAGVAIKTIIAGMGAEFGGLMEKQSQKLFGKISNLQDTFGQSLTKLGEVLIPFANQAVDLAAQVVDGFAGAVDVFSNMSPAVQGAVVAFTGLAAAIGPIVTAVGGMMVAWGALGPSIAAAGSAMAAVATGPVGITVAAVAGLAAAAYALADQLGVLDPILDAFGTAFDYIGSAIVAVVSNFKPLVVGIGAFAAELVGANPLVAALAGWVGDKLAWAFSTIGGIIKTALLVQLQALGAAFSWVADKAKAVFDFFVKKGKTALGETGTAFKTTAKASEELLTELDELTGSAKKAEPAVKDTAAASLVLATNTKAAKVAVFDLEDATRKWEAANKESDRIAKAAAVTLAQQFSPAALGVKVDIDAVSAASSQAMLDVQTWTQTAADKWDATAAKAGATANEVKAAFSAMGVSTKSDLQAAADEAERNFDLIAGSGEASATAIDTAWAAMLQARKDALIANGSDLGVEEQNILDDLLRRQRDHSSESGTIWSGWGETIQNAANSLDIGHKIFDGSFKPENFKSTLLEMGNAFKTAFVDKAADAINSLIDGAIKALFGELDSLGGAFGSVLGGIGSGGGGGAGSGVGIPGLPGGGGGGGAGAAGSVAGAGVSQVVGMVTGAVSAVSGVIGNFQFAAMNKSLDLIETETRETKLWISTNVAPALWQINEAVSWGPGVKAAEALLAFTQGAMFQKIDGIFTATSWGPNVKANERSAEELTGLRSDISSLRATLEALLGRDIVLNIDGEEIARVVGAHQEAQRAIA